MSITRAVLIHDAFPGVNKQVHVWIGDQMYRVFGEGEHRKVRKVNHSKSQPLVRSKRERQEVLAAADRSLQ